MAIQQALLMLNTSSGAQSATLNTWEYTRAGASPCYLKIASDGFVYALENSGSYISQYAWLTGSGTGADYDIWCTMPDEVITPFSGGSFDTWLNLGTDQIWSRTALNMQFKIGIGDFQIRNTHTTATLTDIITISVSCDRT